MKLKGSEKLREKLPGYPGRKIFLIPLRAIVVAFLGYICLIVLDILPRVFSEITILVILEPVLPLLGSLVTAIISVWLIGTMWSRRNSMKSEFGNLAYQKMIPNGLTGIALLIPIVFHAFTSIRSLPLGSPVNDLTIDMATPLLQILGLTPTIDVLIRLMLSGFTLILALLVVRSAFLTFGIDYMTVVYLYYPEESELQEHEIYSILRHPTYLGAALLGAAGMLSRFTIYSILIFTIFYILLRVQIRREEIELIDRFGEGYAEYRKRVPALYVHPRNLRLFIKFLRPSS